MMKIVAAIALVAGQGAADVTIGTAMLKCGNAAAVTCSSDVSDAASLAACLNECEAADKFVTISAVANQLPQICSGTDRAAVALGGAHDALSAHFGEEFAVADAMTLTAFDMNIAPTGCNAQVPDTIVLGLANVAPSDCSSTLANDDTITSTSNEFRGSGFTPKVNTKAGAVVAEASGNCSGAVANTSGSLTVDVNVALADQDTTDDTDATEDTDGTDSEDSTDDTDAATASIHPLTATLAAAAIAISTATIF